MREMLAFVEARQQHLPISNHTTQPSVVACPRNQIALRNPQSLQKPRSQDRGFLRFAARLGPPHCVSQDRRLVPDGSREGQNRPPIPHVAPATSAHDATPRSALNAREQAASIVETSLVSSSDA